MTVSILGEGARNPAGIFKHIPLEHPTKKKGRVGEPSFQPKTKS